MASATPINVDNIWPKEVKDEYEPVRILGKGGFASVILAKGRSSGGSKNNNNNNKFVAMKLVGPTAGANSDQTATTWKMYAHREVDILKELSHPNIIQVINVWELDSESKNSPVVIALQYVKGPTVMDLLLHRGALNPQKFGRVVTAQLVDAVAYLHNHAVIHRDIKPDNVIVTGALSSQNEIWETVKENKNKDELAKDEVVAWEKLLKKWHVTLIDFGFARALTKDDVSRPSVDIRRENLDASYSVRNLDAALGGSTGRRSSSVGDSLHGNSRHGSILGNNSRHAPTLGNNSRHGSMVSFNLDLSQSQNGGGGDTLQSQNSPKRRISRRQSFSRKLHRQMSALGNRQYAAPEILKVEHVLNPNVVVPGSSATSALTNTLSEYCADYGLLVDSYSLGHTIRYMMTGVPPHESVEEKIAYKKSVIYKLGKLFCNKSNSASTPTKIYRPESELPGEVQRLITKLTERLESNRTSVRAARRYPWIEDVLPASPTDNNKGEITYLSFATSKELGIRKEETAKIAATTEKRQTNS